MKVIHFHWNMVAKKPLTACGIHGIEGETVADKVTCVGCKDWLAGKTAPTPKIKAL